MFMCIYIYIYVSIYPYMPIMETSLLSPCNLLDVKICFSFYERPDSKGNNKFFLQSDFP